MDELKVKITLYDPDAGYGVSRVIGRWPVVEGVVVQSIMGLYGKRWYIIKLKTRLSRWFNPLKTGAPKIWGRARTYLLIAPLATPELPSDFIGESLARRETITVHVAVCETPEKMPPTITVVNNDVYPYLCAGTLEPVD